MPARRSPPAVSRTTLADRVCASVTQIPPYALVFITLSKRLHSIYVLRMFNDGVGMLFLYGAVMAWTARRPRWNVGCVLFR